ncbi:exported hypothetical protein [Bradyrhizobium sp. STM 3843]|nr:exported hypothetical protein [Bradyrhizobium sp. STM 3843]
MGVGALGVCGGAAGVAAGGTAATDGGAVGIGGGAPAAGPDGGARLTAAPGSGTAAGGTGGGRSLKNCAFAGPTPPAPSKVAAANSARSLAPRRSLVMPPRLVIIVLLFTENAANSSLCIHGGPRDAAFPARWSHLRALQQSSRATTSHEAAWGCRNRKMAPSDLPLVRRVRSSPGWRFGIELRSSLMRPLRMERSRTPEHERA